MFGEVIDQQIRNYLAYWHGVPEDLNRQYQYYRCLGCRGIVTWKAIRVGGCDCGLSNRIRAAHLKWYEKARLLVAPWSV